MDTVGLLLGLFPSLFAELALLGRYALYENCRSEKV